MGFRKALILYDKCIVGGLLAPKLIHYTHFCSFSVKSNNMQGLEQNHW